MAKRPFVDKQKCIGCGACVALCPEVFEMGSDGKASVKGVIKPSKLTQAKTAAENCPVGAITFE